MPRVVRFEIPTGDPKRSLKFYKEVFGWEAKSDSPGNWLLQTGPDDQPGINGGLMLDDSMGIVITIEVASVDDVVASIVQHGGKVHGKVDIPGVGLLAHCQDTHGNPFTIREKQP